MIIISAVKWREGGLLHAGICLPSCWKNRRREQTGAVCYSASLPSDMHGASLSIQFQTQMGKKIQLTLFAFLPSVCSVSPPSTGVAEKLSRLQAGCIASGCAGGASLTC